MNFRELIELKSRSMTPLDMRRLLNLGKTDSYWLIQQKKFESTRINGKYYINIESFEKWYANQIKYRKLDGSPPGSELNSHSYSVGDITALLGVSDSVIYDRIQNGEFETFLIDGWLRITKTSFERWYKKQTRFRTDIEKQNDYEAEHSSITLTDAARLLGTHRNNIYALIQTHSECFDIIIIADRKRITIESFERWYQGQSKYKKVITEEPSTTYRASSTPVQPDNSGLEPPEMISPEVVKTSDKSYYTIEEVQTMLSLTKRDAYLLVQSNCFKFIKIGRRYVIPRDSFDEWRMLDQAKEDI